MVLYYSALALDPKQSGFQRLLNWGKALGSSLHHGSFLFICSLVVAGQVVPTRPLVSLGLPLLLMHFAELLEYVAKPLYYTIVMIAEIWFQCEIFATLPTQPLEMKMAFWAMIIAHWIVVTCCAAGILKPSAEADGLSKTNKHKHKPFVLELVDYLREARHFQFFPRCQEDLNQTFHDSELDQPSTVNLAMDV